MPRGDAVALGTAAAVLLGLVVGSFLNVVVYRVPRGRSIVSPGSACPRCGHELSWWENLPVLSWLLLVGRCHACREPISPRYPVVELVTGLTFGWVTWTTGATWSSVGFCLLAGTMTAVLLIELDGHRTPSVVPGVGVGLALVAFLVAAVRSGHWLTFAGPLLGSAAGAGAAALLRRTERDDSELVVVGPSSLTVTGCWLGGLPAVSIVAGGVTVLAGGLLILAANVAAARPGVRATTTGSGIGVRDRRVPLPLPLLMSAAMVLALIVAR
jgi:prepilin signal peptidase PulO-like enzyme (type II secretory pathway)